MINPGVSCHASGIVYEYNTNGYVHLHVIMQDIELIRRKGVNINLAGLQEAPDAGAE
jgi:hypothetical protein